MSVRPLPTGTPSAEGVDASGVHAFLDALEASPDIEPHSLMLLRHGKVVASGWWAPYTADRPHLLYSLSKSFTATAAAFAVAEGLLRLDDTVISYFPEFDADITDPRSRAMLVRHVATMASGHAAETHEQALAADREEPVRGFLLLPPDGDPGTVFAYNQPTTYTLAAIVQRVTGQTLTDYLRPRLFDPIGIGDVAWLTDRTGRQLGYSGLHATTDAIARLGRLYLQDGVWEGERVLPEGWVEEATRSHIASGDESWSADWRHGYGYQFWMSQHGYRGDGAYGQYCLVLPEQDAVIAFTGATDQMQAVLDLVWRHLLPAFGRTTPEADASLAERMAGLALPPAAGKPAQLDGAVTFTPYDGGCAGLPRLTAVEVGADGRRVTLVEDGHRLELGCGEPGWTVTEGPVPAAVSGGWTDEDTLVLDVALLETPHHLDVTCSLTDRTFTAKWRTQPLHSSRIGAMRAPRDSV
ncbi:serine hydrolase domain-containing protein [Streptomyces justiciae]|uniref:serine hydrolase domain-containing protein n=1 Tax=Streptomyces justiciae TaxID=2780140 RepID=UPI001880A2AA|nr:serine hydrolase domain-containing protein [Streptomyces justiciae]MBE8470154.1 beta-lactamase family protein [Streptomyces justiciae]